MGPLSYFGIQAHNYYIKRMATNVQVMQGMYTIHDLPFVLYVFKCIMYNGLS